MIHSLKRQLRESQLTQRLYHVSANLLERIKHRREIQEAKSWLQSYERITTFHGGLGDDLMSTAALKGLSDSGFSNVAVLTDYPFIFENNPHVAAILPKRYPQFMYLGDGLNGTFRLLHYQPPKLRHDKALSLNHNVIRQFCVDAGVTVPCELRPWFYLPEPIERSKQVKIAVQSSCLTARYPNPNKEWGPHKIQKVLQLSSPSIQFVQIGSSDDPLLSGVQDARGISILESAKLLRSCHAFFGLEGFQMHLARALDVRSIVIYGGRIKPHQIGYPCNENLVTSPPCSPCYETFHCDHDRVCLDRIHPHEVAQAIERLLERLNDPLETEWFDPASVHVFPQR